MSNQTLVIVDFGGPFSHALARKIRSFGIYCEIRPYSSSHEKLIAGNPLAYILSGDAGLGNADLKLFDNNLFELGKPILAVGYAATFLANHFGSEIKLQNDYEQRLEDLKLEATSTSQMFKSVSSNFKAAFYVREQIISLSQKFSVTARTGDYEIAAFEDATSKLFGLRFQPENSATENGEQILKNFLFDICDFTGDWSMETYVERTIAELKEKIGDKKVLCALSGGVDSTVSAVMVHKAVGKNLTCVFVDHGLLRKNEADSVEKLCRSEFDMNLIRLNAQDRFLDKLAGVSDPEQKRKIIGEEFIRSFEDIGREIGSVDYLVQGTIYPDIIESGVGAAVIKSHHNVGGLPDV
ncbi:MAG TPA: ATP-binding protein, partial [Clostridiales bacterium]|nr:ATP-binding protein [Clostridiales bacterium]